MKLLHVAATILVLSAPTFAFTNLTRRPSKILGVGANQALLSLATSPAFTTVADLTNQFELKGEFSVVTATVAATVSTNGADEIHVRALLDGGAIYGFFGATTPAGGGVVTIPGTFWDVSVPPGLHTMTIEMQHNNGATSASLLQATVVVEAGKQ